MPPLTSLSAPASLSLTYCLYLSCLPPSSSPSLSPSHPSRHPPALPLIPMASYSYIFFVLFPPFLSLYSELSPYYSSLVLFFLQCHPLFLPTIFSLSLRSSPFSRIFSHSLPSSHHLSFPTTTPVYLLSLFLSPSLYLLSSLPLVRG